MNGTNSIVDAIAFGLQGDLSPGPLYRRLANAVGALIRTNRLAPNAALPPERDLAESLGLGRVTVRNAYKELIASGLVEQRQGSGTFVADRAGRISQPLWSLTSFSEDMVSRGKRPGARILTCRMDLPSPDEAFKLGVGAGVEVLRLERLRLADNRPMAIERAVVPASFIDIADFDGTSLYAALERRGHRPVQAMQRLTSVLATGEDAALLDVSEGAPVLVIERLSRLADERVVECTRSLYRGDAYDFVAELRTGARS